MKKVGKFVLGLLVVVVIVVLVYLMYVLVSYHRIEDMQPLESRAPEQVNDKQALKTNETYTAMSYNIGFGAYTPEFSFFMNGGKYSWAQSEESVINSVNGAADFVASFEPDFMLLQEVDTDSTRSYHVNEYDLFSKVFSDYYAVFAMNYDSAFLMYPLQQPHGKSKSGIVTYSRYPITDALRRSLPISTSLSKLLDLDRCYSISRVPVENGKELVVINLHMSAYGHSDEVREGQIAMLCGDLEREYAAGNYVICGGDFNHDLKTLEDDGSERESWEHPFPREKVPEHFNFCIDLISEEEKEGLWNSLRSSDIEYIEGVTKTIMLDGFLISDNVECLTYETLNTGYQYSDHEPVHFTFQLKE